FFEHLSRDWPKRLTEKDLWKQLYHLPLQEFQNIKAKLKSRLLNFLRDYVRDHLLNVAHKRPELATVLSLLNERTILVTHAKRLATYKRADLLIRNIERMKRLFPKDMAILFIFAGKAHPSDGEGQDVLRRIMDYSRHPELKGHILFIENYEIQIGRRLMAGSDLWLNTPLRPLEACGTSGMKAGINGTLNFSVADGWWPEAYNGRNGWMVGTPQELFDAELQDLYDADQIFEIFEHEVFPLFRDHLKGGNGWAERIRESMISLIPFVAAERMMNEYDKTFYSPAIARANALRSGNFQPLTSLIGMKDQLLKNWSRIQFADAKVSGIFGPSLVRTKAFRLDVLLKHPDLPAEYLDVQALFHSQNSQRRTGTHHQSLELVEIGEGESHWRIKGANRPPGSYTLSVRVLPRVASLNELEPLDLGLHLVKWL
ncbi:MAG: hypothetical protein C5B49_10485, partial [Bdellovibrio sp.]